jgi:primosomal protein N''
MLRTYFLNETEQIIDRLTSTVERQDNDVNQLSQELIDELRAVEVAEVVNEIATNENEPVENVSELSESLQLADDQNQ